MTKKKNETNVAVEETEVYAGEMFQPDQEQTINNQPENNASAVLIENINNLISAIEYAHGKGVYTMEETVSIWQTINNIKQILA